MAYSQAWPLGFDLRKIKKQILLVVKMTSHPWHSKMLTTQPCWIQCTLNTLSVLFDQACYKHLCPPLAMHVKNAVIWSTCLVLIYLYCLLANHDATFFSFPCFCTTFTTNWIAVSQSDSIIFSCTLLKDKQSLKKFHNTK